MTLNNLEVQTVDGIEKQSEASPMVQLRDISNGKVPLRSLTPDFRAHDLTQIDFQRLHEEFGIDHFYFDVDNTLTQTKGDAVDPRFLQFLLEQHEAGYLPYIHLTTDSGRDLTEITTALGADRIPTPRILRKQSHTYWNKRAREHPPQTSVMIGDSPTWDIRGANSVGMVTVMVEPFSPYATIERALLKPSMDTWVRAKIDEQYGEKSQPPVKRILAPA